MDKTIGWYVEQFGGLFIGLLIGAFFLKYFNLTEELNDSNAFVSKISDISFIIFGFLLAFIGLIINSKKRINQAFGGEIVFNRTIELSFRIVKLSVANGIYGLILWILFQSKIHFSPFLKELFIDLLIVILVWLIIDLIYFTRIFFKLIKKYS